MRQALANLGDANRAHPLGDQQRLCASHRSGEIVARVNICDAEAIQFHHLRLGDGGADDEEEEVSGSWVGRSGR
jgi:hypothetical protein